MKNLLIPMFILGCMSLLAGYFRFIVDDNGNIPLNRFRLTGCIGDVLVGMVLGTRDLCARQLSDKAKSALLVYGGIALLFLGFRFST
ncbi:hypothetical protein [Acaryochloris sp. IP29b_bin.137]|uniref:hypothetical protein n=1 Tax=Acaryochloris sp. IP29b_bin.137 TaxID=2969217 RepID=UPI00261629C4|nr:hypothetical protein [Acaryochloris sp. IP29b_bin.137]